MSDTPVVPSVGKPRISKHLRPLATGHGERSRLMAAPGLYLHVPFCSAVCPYCDFAVTTGDRDRRRRFVDGLLAEIRLAAADPWPGVAEPPAERFDTLYFGGGTPSLLAPDELAEIVAELRGVLPVADDAVLHLEANPEDVSPASVAGWHRLGVGFLSLGVQSFDDARLRLLGRRHDGPTAHAAVATALASGFATVSLDLIYGLPREDAEAWRRELETAAALGPDHLSCYQLTVEPGTPFAARRDRGRLVEPPPGALARRFRSTHRWLGERGWTAYEISSFARGPAHRSRHNRKYWRHEPYLGLGPSAHSYAGRRRWWNRRSLTSWLAAVEAGERPIEGGEELTAEQRALEAVFLGLRTPEGIDLAALERSTGVDLAAANPGRLDRMVDAGLLRREPGRLRPSRRGLAVADGLAAALRLVRGGAARPEPRACSPRGSAAATSDRATAAGPRVGAPR